MRDIFFFFFLGGGGGGGLVKIHFKECLKFLIL